MYLRPPLSAQIPPWPRPSGSSLSLLLHHRVPPLRRWLFAPAPFPFALSTHLWRSSVDRAEYTEDPGNHRVDECRRDSSSAAPDAEFGYDSMRGNQDV